jgi:hypothetical protein
MIRRGLLIAACAAPLPALDLDRELAWWGPLMDGISPMVALGAGTDLRLDGLRRVERDGSPMDGMAVVAWQETDLPAPGGNGFHFGTTTRRAGVRIGSDALHPESGRPTAALGGIAAGPFWALWGEVQIRDTDAPVRAHLGGAFLIGGELSATIDRDVQTVCWALPMRVHGAESTSAWMIWPGIAATHVVDGESLVAARLAAWYAWQPVDPLLIAIGGEAVSATLREDGQERSGPLAQAVVRVGMAW